MDEWMEESAVGCPMSDVREWGESVTEQIKSAKDS